jgi:hypothetical protein
MSPLPLPSEVIITPKARSDDLDHVLHEKEGTLRRPMSEKRPLDYEQRKPRNNRDGERLCTTYAFVDHGLA